MGTDHTEIDKLQTVTQKELAEMARHAAEERDKNAEIERVRGELLNLIDGSDLPPDKKEALRSSVNSNLDAFRGGKGTAANLIAQIRNELQQQLSQEKLNEALEITKVLLSHDGPDAEMYNQLSDRGKRRVASVVVMIDEITVSYEKDGTFSKETKASVGKFLKAEVIDPAAPAPLANNISEHLMDTPQVRNMVVDLKATDPDAVKRAVTETEFFKEREEKHITDAKNPAQAARMKAVTDLAPCCKKTDKILTEMANHPENADKLLEKVKTEFQAYAEPRYATYLGKMTSEQQALLGKVGNLPDVLQEYAQIRKDPARHNAALHAKDNSSDPAKTDAAILEIVMTLAAERQLAELVANAKSKEKEYAKFFAPETTNQMRAEQLLQQMKATYPGADNDRLTMAADSIIATVNQQYRGDFTKMASATQSDIELMAKKSANMTLHSASDAVGALMTNFFTTDKKVTDEVSLSIGRGVKRNLEGVLGEEAGQNIGHAVTATLKIGADIKNNLVVPAVAQTIATAQTLWNTAFGDSPEEKAAKTKEMIDKGIDKILPALEQQKSYWNGANKVSMYGGAILDIDGDGKIEKEELKARLKKLGLENTLDRDGDGSLNGQELSIALNTVIAKEKAREQAQLEVMNKEGFAKFKVGKKSLFDLDGDGKIEVEELRNVLKAHGVTEQKLDLNQDGNISDGELRGAMRKIVKEEGAELLPPGGTPASAVANKSKSASKVTH